MQLLQKIGIGRNADDEIAAAESALSEARDAVTRAELEHSETIAKIDRMVKSEVDDHAERIINGAEACPPKPKRLTAIANAKSRVSGFEVALPILRQRVLDQQAVLESAKAKRAAQIFPVINDSRMHALNELRVKVSECLPLLATLAAHESVQDELLGRSFRVPADFETQDDIDAAMLVTAFLKQLPPMLRPEDQEIEQLHRSIANQASDALTQINGEI